MSFPGPETIVAVEAPGDVELTAEVIATTATGVTVEWGGEAPEAGAGMARWPGERGLNVIACNISGAGRYGLLEATGESTVVQRRDAVRVELNVPVRRLDSARRESALTINLSAKGLLVSGHLGMQVGETGTLGIDLPDCPHDPLCAEGRVLHNKDAGLWGIELIGLSRGEQDRLAHVVFEQQRVLLRRRHAAKTPLRLVKGGLA